MIKEYEDVKKYMQELFNSKYPSCTVIINDMYTEEYNALDISIINGISTLTTDFYLDIKYQLKKEWSHIINDIEKLVIPGQITILIYFKPIMEIRSHKITKIKLKIPA